MSPLGAAIRLQMDGAHGAGHTVHHVQVCPAHWQQTGLPAASYVPGAHSKRTVVWARSKDHRLIPYVVEP